MDDNPDLKFYETTATRKIFELDKRIRAVAGGTAASKTVSIIVWLIAYSQTHKGKLVDVISESYPHLEAGSMLDFQRIMKAHNYWKRDRWNETKHTYVFETGTVLRFRSLDLSSAHGPRRDVLFLNECNHIPLSVFDQLEPRTREIIWMDWNPSTEFWFYTDVLEQRKEDVDFITLTYKDNEALDAPTVKSIESRQHQKMWWQVYGLGQLGEVEGRVYTGWVPIEEIPHEARLMRFGLDFGYSIDPAAIVAIYYYNGGYIIDEVLYAKGMSNQRVAEVIRDQEQHVVTVADSAEPKSIDEVHRYGIPIIPCRKGKDVKNSTINFIQDQRISYTTRSINLIKEYRGYLWATDKDGVQFNPPKTQDFDDHLMDALRYGMESIKAPAKRPRQRPRQVTLGMPA